MKTRTIVTLGPDDPALVLEDTATNEYSWQVGVSHELIIYKTGIHETFSARSGTKVWQVWAAGQWTHVMDEELEEEVEEVFKAGPARKPNTRRKKDD